MHYLCGINQVSTAIRFIRRFSQITLITVFGLYFLSVALLNIPAIQQRIAVQVTDELKGLLHTDLSVGNVDIGLLNRIILDDVWMNDRQGRPLLKVDKLSARFAILPVLEGKITVHSIQLFGLKAQLLKETPESAPNFRFLVDAFASSDTTSQTPLHLRINSVLIRKGEIGYHVISEPDTPNEFNPSHIHVDDLRANISLKALTTDSLNATVRQLSFREQSGFQLSNLSLKAVANKQEATLSRFEARLPETFIQLDTLLATYQWDAPDRKRTLRFKGGISPSFVTLRDISMFVPALSPFRDKLRLHGHLSGSLNHLVLEGLEIHSDNKDVSLRANGEVENLFVDSLLTVKDLQTDIRFTSTGALFLYRNLTGDEGDVPPVISRIGNSSIQLHTNGPLNNLSTHAVVHTAAGSLESRLLIDGKAKQTSYSGMLNAQDFQLGTLLGEEDLGDISLNLDVKGKLTDDKYPDCFLKGVVSAFTYKNYTYHNIRLDGVTQKGGYDGLLTLDDPNGKLTVNGSFNTAQKIPSYNLTARLEEFRPNDLHLTDKHEGTSLSMNLTMKFTGNTLDNLEGSIDLNKLLMIAPTDYYYMDSLHISATRDKEMKRIRVQSDFMTGDIEGDINFATLPVSVNNILHSYLPSLTTYNDRGKKKRGQSNRFQFSFLFLNSDMLSKLFLVPVNLYTASTLNGYIDESAGKFRIEGNFPDFNYGDSRYESGMLLCENPSEEAVCHLRASKHMKEESTVNLAVNAQAKDDRLKTSFLWGNNTDVTYSGEVSATTRFMLKDEKSHELVANVRIDPGTVILNDTVWNLHASSIQAEKGKVEVNDFLFEHNDQHLKVNGRITGNKEDSLTVDLNRIKLEYVFDILQFHPVDFKGLASGKAYVSNLFDEPDLRTHLFVEQFKFNDGLMGDMHISGRWDKERGILLDADIHEGELSHTAVQGFVTPLNDSLDLRIVADKTNLDFLNRYVRNIFDHVSGRTTGTVRLYGPFSDLNLIGDAMADASLKVGILGNTYYLRDDSIKLRYNRMLFDGIRFYDSENHSGRLNGHLNHDHLGGEMSYEFRIETDRTRIYDGKKSNDATFYGTVYGTGLTTLSGDKERLDIDMDIRTDDGTVFTYNADSPGEVTDNEFITFVDRTPKRKTGARKYSYRPSTQEEEEEDAPMDVRFNLQVDVTPQANIRVMMDPLSGDIVSTRGNGALRANYYNKGDFKMYGTYTLDYGSYKLSLQEVIRKEFQLKPGGTVTFSGDPYEGNMNIQAAYTVNSASLTDLIPGANFTQNSVRVNCLMNLTGHIFNPDITFDLELPTINEEEREMVRSYISTDEQMEMQIIYLLGIGRFYTYDYAANATDDNSGQSSAMSSLLSTTLSGQLNNMLSHVINSSNWNFGTNFSTGTKGWTDMEVEGMLSGRLLNNRLLINGNFGYRDNPLANSNFIGDFDIQWLLTPSGEISLKGYNQTNDRYFTKTTLTTQGFGIIFKKDFDRWMDLFRTKRKSNVSPAPSKERTDSIPGATQAKAYRKRNK